jgi:hypothetical protein
VETNQNQDVLSEYDCYYLVGLESKTDSLANPCSSTAATNLSSCRHTVEEKLKM